MALVSTERGSDGPLSELDSLNLATPSPDKDVQSTAARRASSPIIVIRMKPVPCSTDRKPARPQYPRQPFALSSSIETRLELFFSKSLISSRKTSPAIRHHILALPIARHKNSQLKNRDVHSRTEGRRSRENSWVTRAGANRTNLWPLARRKPRAKPAPRRYSKVKRASSCLASRVACAFLAQPALPG